MEAVTVMANEDRLLTYREACALLGFSEVWLRQRVREGKLKCLTLGDGPKAPKRFELLELKRFARSFRLPTVVVPNGDDEQ